jgi:hypothetical protein
LSGRPSSSREATLSPQKRRLISGCPLRR